MSTDQDDTKGAAMGRLSDTVRRMRIASADRSDVVVELRDAARARLELLAQDLLPVIAEVPEDDDRFDFSLSSGLQPRFWIDATAHVAMGTDRRTYRFVRDTRLGRIVLAESADRDAVIDRIVTYVAMRLYERELTLSGDTISYRDVAAGRAGAQHADEPRAGRDRDEVRRAVARLRSAEEAPPPSAAAPEPAAHAPQPASVPQPTPAPMWGPPTPERGDHARAILSGLLWALLGAMFSAGVLLLFLRDVLVQR